MIFIDFIDSPLSAIPKHVLKAKRNIFIYIRLIEKSYTKVPNGHFLLSSVSTLLLVRGELTDIDKS